MTRMALPAPRPFTVSPFVLHTLLLMLMISGPLTNESLLPALPALSMDFDAPMTRIQLLVSIFMLGYGSSQLVIGPLADAVGRRPVLIIGLGMFVLASGAAALSPALPALIAARFVQGVSISVAPVLARVIVRDMYDQQRATRLLAYLGAIMALGPGVAPIISNFVQLWWGWRAIFVALVVIGGLLGVSALALLPETRPRSDIASETRRHVGHTYARLLRHGVYVRSVLAMMLLFAGMYSFFVSLPFIVNRLYQQPDARIGLIYAVVVAGYIVGGLALGWLSTRFSQRRLLVAGFGVAALAMALLAGLSVLGLPPFWLLILLISGYTAGYGMLVAPLTVRVLGLFPHQTGAAAAVLGCTEWLGTAAISWLAVQLLAQGFLPFILLVLAALASAWMLLSRDAENA